MGGKKAGKGKAQKTAGKAGNAPGASSAFPGPAVGLAVLVLGLAIVAAAVYQPGGQQDPAELQPLIPYGLVDDGEKVVGLSPRAIQENAKKLPCKDKHPSSKCASYAASGHCGSAPGWMSVHCAASCNACELLNPKVRCDSKRIGYDNPNAWESNTNAVDNLFSGLPSRFPEYNVTFLSTPESSGPWVAHFSNFLSDAEIQTLIDATGGNLQRSTDQGGFDENGVQEQVESTSRTSENAWCMGDCEENPIVRRIVARIERVTGVPQGNFESFQLLRYSLNQEYKRHHDMSPSDNKMLAGPRILTFFLYLSDVEEGGGTQFTDLEPPLTVEPKKGSAILWPSVMNDDVTQLDQNTHHAALPVRKGIKLAANAWIHLRNYRIPNLYGK